MDSSDKEKELWRKYFRNKSPEIKEQLTLMYLPKTKALTASIYARRPGEAIDFDDYFHFAVLGLIEAIDAYKVEKNDNFFNYARLRIKGAVLDGIYKMTEKGNALQQQNTYQQRLHSIKKKKPDTDQLFYEFIDIAIGLAIGVVLEQDFSAGNGVYEGHEALTLKEELAYCIQHLEPELRAVLLYH